MINSKQIVEWINRNDPVDFQSDQRIITAIQQTDDQSTSPQQLDVLITYLTRLSGSILSELEYGDVMLHCALAKYDRGDLPDSREYCGVAIAKYSEAGDEYREAIANIALGLILWALVDNKSAWTCWDKTREYFESEIKNAQEEINYCSSDEEAKPLQERKGWFEDRLFDLNVGFVDKSEEIYTWINCFSDESTQLKSLSQRLRKQISEVTGDNNIPEMREKLDQLYDVAHKNVNNPETPEIFMYCGLIRLQLGEVNEAVKTIKAAIEMFGPESHKQSVARWMLGMAYWRIPDYDKAYNSWEHSIKSFELLRKRADSRDIKIKKGWYDEKIKHMKERLQEIMANL